MLYQDSMDRERYLEVGVDQKEGKQFSCRVYTAAKDRLDFVGIVQVSKSLFSDHSPSHTGDNCRYGSHCNASLDHVGFFPSDDYQKTDGKWIKVVKPQQGEDDRQDRRYNRDRDRDRERW